MQRPANEKTGMQWVECQQVAKAAKGRGMRGSATGPASFLGNAQLCQPRSLHAGGAGQHGLL